MASPASVNETSRAQGSQRTLRKEPITGTTPRNNAQAGARAVRPAGRRGWPGGPGAGAWTAGQRRGPSPHHPLQGTGDARGLVQQLAVLQLLAEPLQRVQRLVQLHGHGHFGQVLPDVIPQDVPQADAAAVGAGRRQARPPPALGFPTAFRNRP